jgi:D-3-phosphoglycerate dehydrogenase / 2-oxoglutarate reductase
MTRIVSTAEVPEIGQRAFAPLGTIETLDRQRTALCQADVLLVRSEHVGADDIVRARTLRVIARTGSGVDNVDVAAATERGIPVVHAPGVGVRPVAEGTIALIVAAAKRLGELAAVLGDGRWDERYHVMGLDLMGATLGIVGYGRIGQEVGGLARALGMAVIAYDPLRPEAESAVDGVELVPLATLAGRSDIVSLHCPLTEDTRGLIDYEVIASMKRGAILVNAARGEIVAGDDLLAAALSSGQLGGIALDVFTKEPPPVESPLLANPRVVCSPHAIGLTRDWNRHVFGTLALDVHRVLAGRAPVHVVNHAALRTAPAGRGA